MSTAEQNDTCTDEGKFLRRDQDVRGGLDVDGQRPWLRLPFDMHDHALRLIRRLANPPHLILRRDVKLGTFLKLYQDFVFRRPAIAAVS